MDSAINDLLPIENQAALITAVSGRHCTSDWFGLVHLGCVYQFLDSLHGWCECLCCHPIVPDVPQLQNARILRVNSWAFSAASDSDDTGATT
jgi:hypothetical protein